MKNKVCILTTVHPPFDTRIFHKQAKTLVQAGYDVTLIAQHDTDEVVGGIKIIALPRPRNRFARIFGLTWRAYRLAVRERADVYHFHDPELLPVGVVLRLLTQKRVIYDVHEHYPNAIMSKDWLPLVVRRLVKIAFVFIEPLLVSRLNAVVYTTPLVGKRYARFKVKSVRVENYPLLEMFEGVHLADLEKREKRLVYLGGLTRIRGILELIEGFSLLQERCPDLDLCLIGRPDPDFFGQEIERHCERLGVAEKVRVIPPVPYGSIKDYLARCFIGIVTYLPYPNHTSCLPNKLFEYMACGLPVIASDFPLYREVIEGANCGKLVDPTKPVEIARAIEETLEDPKGWCEMSRNGYQAFRTKYNWTNETERLLAVYEELLA